jgi:hypothetical protein
MRSAADVAANGLQHHYPSRSGALLIIGAAQFARYYLG